MNEIRYAAPASARDAILADAQRRAARQAYIAHATHRTLKPLWVGAAVVMAAVVGLAVGFVRGQAAAQNHYLISLDRAEGAFHATRKGCEAAQGSEWGACIAKALSDKWRAMAEADVRLRNTPEAYRIQRVVDAGTLFLTEVQECSQMSGSRRAVCDNVALDAFRQAMGRATGTESASTDCTLSGCPVPMARTSRKGSRV